MRRILPELDRYVRLAPFLRCLRWAARTIFVRKKLAQISSPNSPKLRILIVGVYLANRDNLVRHLVKRFASTPNLEVEQAWASMLAIDTPSDLSDITKLSYPTGKPKFQAINQLLALYNVNDYDFILVSDDDIAVPQGFLDLFVAAQHQCAFAVAQPARTVTSCGSKGITLARRGGFARQTRFVEIGPLFSFARSAYALLLPFDEENGMGWGMDYHWPVVISEAGLTMGIIDCAPVDHSIRPLAKAYSGESAKRDMTNYLNRVSHLSIAEAETTLKCFPHPH